MNYCGRPLVAVLYVAPIYIYYYVYMYNVLYMHIS